MPSLRGQSAPFVSFIMHLRKRCSTLVSARALSPCARSDSVYYFSTSCMIQMGRHSQGDLAPREVDGDAEEGDRECDGIHRSATTLLLELPILKRQPLLWVHLWFRLSQNCSLWI